jgi:CIC family chloride channel protein
MVTVGFSTLLSQYMRRYSIYTLKLFNRGVPLERDRDVDLMQGVTVGEVMTPSPDIVPEKMTLRELSDTFTRTSHHGFPVLDSRDRLSGIVTLKDLEGAADDPGWPELKVSDIAQRDLLTAYPDEPISKALGRMSIRDLGRMPVVDRKDSGRLVGLLRRNDIIHAYRHAVRRKLESQYRDECLQLGRLTETDIVELVLTSGMPGVGRRIKELKLPTHALITSVIREGEIVIAHGDTLLQAGDKVIVITRRGSADAVRNALLGKR